MKHQSFVYQNEKFGNEKKRPTLLKCTRMHKGCVPQTMGCRKNVGELHFTMESVQYYQQFTDSGYGAGVISFKKEKKIEENYCKKERPFLDTHSDTTQTHTIARVR